MYVSYLSGFEEWYKLFLTFGWTKIEGCYLFEGTTEELIYLLASTLPRVSPRRPRKCVTG
jgi:hypothetical protein